jgi:uncharacterized protein (TIGR03118 family)
MKSLVRFAVGTFAVLSMGALSQAQEYVQTNLVSGTAGVAPVTDPNLKDPWGLSRASGSDWWASNDDSGTATLYNGAGIKNPLVVTIPSTNPAVNPQGKPTGVIANSSTTDFQIVPGKPAAFIFATLDGGIVAWNPNVLITKGQAAPSTNAVLMDRGAVGSVYTGITSNFIKGQRFLYVANFSRSRIDVYNNQFQHVNLSEITTNEVAFNQDRAATTPALPFTDNEIPANFSPFNVESIGPDVVVTYGQLVEGVPVAQGGEGLGYVDVYSSSGQLLTRLEHVNQLNAPWGVALAPLDFGAFSHDLLIGQFGGGGTTPFAGTIAAFDLATGKFEGTLENASGQPITIPGLWTLSVGNVAPANLDPSKSPAAEVYFSANDAGQGLFGYFSAVTTQLTEGSDQ